MQLVHEVIEEILKLTKQARNIVLRYTNDRSKQISSRSCSVNHSNMLCVCMNHMLQIKKARSRYRHRHTLKNRKSNRLF